MTVANPSRNSKHPLSIRLAESVVFLRGSGDSIRPHRRRTTVESPPAMLRGLLTLHLTKPTRICSIEIVLEGKIVIQWPEGANQRRIDVTQDKKFLSARTVFFDAQSCFTCKRSASVGPCTKPSDPELDHYEDFGPSEPPASARHPSSDYSFFPAPGTSTNLSISRRNSAESYRWNSETVSHETIRSFTPDHLSTPPLSPPYTPNPPYAELPVISRPSSPMLLSSESSQHSSRSMKHEENPGQMLEDFRNALRMEIGGSTRSHISSRLSSNSLFQNVESSSSESSVSTPMYLMTTPPRFESPPGSRSASRDVDNRQPRPSSLSVQQLPMRHDSPSPAHSPATPPGNFRSRQQLSGQLSEDDRGRRSSARWSLSNMSSVFKEAKEKIRGISKDPEHRRGRNPEPRPSDEHHVDFIITDEDVEHKKREERKKTLGKLTAVVGHDESSSVETWKEFRKGTYTYPISFVIPSTSPPTVHCDYGAVTYRLKAVVHRPGALVSKLVATREVTLVASPADDDTEETQYLTVERQWDTQLRYLISLSGRSFVIGSQIPFTLTLIPMEKCKLHRISILLEEKVEYTMNDGKTTREQPVQRFELLSIRHPAKGSPPILPIDPEHASIFVPYLDSSSTTDEALASLMGPGPWVLSRDLQLPVECGKIHFTYKQKNVNVSVNHTLKIILRVERGDDQFMDLRTNRRRLFDIVVQTPIHILSCHCNAEWISLPRYSLFEPVSNSTSADFVGTVDRTCACSGAISTTIKHHVSPYATPCNSRPATAEPRPNGNVTPFGFAEGFLPALPPPDLASSSHQFARLITGEESVLGDTPPRYQQVLIQGR